MELDGKAVEVANMQRAEVMVEGVVEQGIVNGEVARRVSGIGARFHSSTCSPLRGGRLRVREEGVGSWSMGVGGEIQAICEVC